MKFLPSRKSDVVTYGGQVYGVLSAKGFDPTTLGLTSADVTKLGTLLSNAQDAHDEANAARLVAKSKTQAVSAPDGALEQLKAQLRDIANAARVSGASDDAVAAIGVSRLPTPSRLSTPCRVAARAKTDLSRRSPSEDGPVAS